MSLTLALGLKYESPQKTEFSPLRQEGLSANLKQDVPSRDTALKSQPVIDVKPIKTTTAATTPATNQQYNYLSYNMHATLNILHAIGTQLHISI